MVCGAFEDWSVDEPVAQTSEAEKLFLKDLYSYMKNRGSPIDRIPNLGFKQSNSTVYTCPITIENVFSYFSYFKGLKNVKSERWGRRTDLTCAPVCS